MKGVAGIRRSNNSNNVVDINGKIISGPQRQTKWVHGIYSRIQ